MIRCWPVFTRPVRHFGNFVRHYGHFKAHTAVVATFACMAVPFVVVPFWPSPTVAQVPYYPPSNGYAPLPHVEGNITSPFAYAPAPYTPQEPIEFAPDAVSADFSPTLENFAENRVTLASVQSDAIAAASVVAAPGPSTRVPEPGDLVIIPGVLALLFLARGR